MIWLRVQRFELVSLGLAVATWAVACLFIAWRLNGFAAEAPDCFGLAITPSYCQAASVHFAGWDQTAEALLWLALALPMFIGIVLGAPVVAREIEEHTAELAWSYALGRVNWLRSRVPPIFVAALIILSIVAVSGEVLTVARLGGEDPGFQRYDQRGVLVVFRGFLALGVALFLGAWLGRTLPAILAAAALSAALVLGSVLVLDAWRRTASEVIERDSPAADEVLSRALIIEPVAILPDGTIISDLMSELPDGVSFDALRVIPSTEYWTWVGREAAVLVAMSGLAVVLGVAVVRRRRPL